MTVTGEAKQFPPATADEFYELRSTALDRLAALEYRARMMGGAVLTAAYSDIENAVHNINEYGVQQGWLSPALED